MRKPLAMLALAVMAWSNGAAVQCVGPTLGPGPVEAAAGHDEHPGQAEHAPAPPSGHDDHGPLSHPSGRDCGILMACGAALGARAAAPGQTPRETFDRIVPSAAATPAAVDLSQDPPPPRRAA
jgi:hypothetical protein